MRSVQEVIANKGRVYFIGIGGIGMSGLARHFKAEGCVVSGYDKTPSPRTDALLAEGISITFSDAAEARDTQADLVVYTPAVPSSHPQLSAYIEEGSVGVHKRSYVLGRVVAPLRTIAVAGSHGKTTITALISHLLYHCGLDMIAFPGGILSGYETNYLRQGQPKWAVVEADEFDRSFLTLQPTLTVLTSVDSDHLDIYGSFEAVEETFSLFMQQTKADGHQIIQKKYGSFASVSCTTYAFQDKQADVYAASYTVEEGRQCFTLPGSNAVFTLAMGGKHNAENAIAALTAASLAGCKEEDLMKALPAFKGIKRRFERVAQGKNWVFIDDYAHHPTEIEALLSSIRAMYAGYRVVAIFQPHLYSRTRDLALDFARALETADQVYVLPIYPAREEPIEGVTSALISEAVQGGAVQVEGTEWFATLPVEGPVVYVTIGAGNIEQVVEPLRDFLTDKRKVYESA